MTLDIHAADEPATWGLVCPSRETNPAQRITRHPPLLALRALKETLGPSPTVRRRIKLMSTHIRGPFDVKMTPQATHDPANQLGRMSLEKRYHGDLDATSSGEMLAAHGSVKGSAGYVAIERVTGTLGGRKGSFVLMHTGIMNRGTPQLTITVVPDSGTEVLAGLSGTMGINMLGKAHEYEFTYEIAPAAT